MNDHWTVCVAKMHNYNLRNKQTHERKRQERERERNKKSAAREAHIVRNTQWKTYPRSSYRWRLAVILCKLLCCKQSITWMFGTLFIIATSIRAYFESHSCLFIYLFVSLSLSLCIFYWLLSFCKSSIHETVK